MRARHRHFNPAHAGAAAAYDSRYISFGNGDAVNTWTSRTGSNNATQANSLSRPTYRAAEINGQPAVEFDGSNDQLATSSVVTSSTEYTIYLFFRNDSTNGTRVYFYNGSTGSNGYGFIRTSGGLRSLLHGGRGDQTFGNQSTVWDLYVGRRQSNTSAVWVNGVSTSINNNAVAVGTPTTTTRIGADPANFYTDGMISSAILFGSPLDASLRRRVEQSIAYSFKHSVS